MPDTARSRILARLEQALQHGRVAVSPAEPPPAARLDREARIDAVRRLQEAVHSEVVVTDRQKWIPLLQARLRRKKVKTLLYAAHTALGKALAAAWEGGGPRLTPVAGGGDAFKELLFQADAAVTTARGAVADSGALILWPDAGEPRSLSLVPPLHVAVLAADTIIGSFAEALTDRNWAASMPTNALLVSGPSKTADIEFQLVFGVHGPQELLIVIVRD
jgi:L-lactate dehydrogenase complex protein LldG